MRLVSSVVNDTFVLLTTLSMALGVFLTGTQIQVIILENNPDYLFPAWHGSLLVMANIIFSVSMALTSSLKRGD